jgi:multisubunit Na+/H+ antiporter MnhG subunit
LALIAIAALLTLAVLATWLGSIGFARLRSACARVHCVTFVTVGAGIPVALASLLADGFSSRALKIVLLELVLLVCGAALAHATGRAIAMREMSPEDT